MSITTTRGTDKLKASQSSTLSDPHLAWTDPASLSSVPRCCSVEGKIGELIRQQVLRYFGTFQARRSGNSTPSLYDPPRALLDRCGIGADTVGGADTILESLELTDINTSTYYVDF